MKQQILHYLAAMWSSAFDAANHGVMVFCGVAGASVALPSEVAALNWHQIIVVFGITFGIALAKYIETHPLEQLVEEVEQAQQVTATATATVSVPAAEPVPAAGNGGVQ